MNRWWGSKSDSDQQASDRNQRAARRTLNSLDLRLSDGSEEDDFDDANSSLHRSLQNITLNLDGEGEASESEGEKETDTMTNAAAAAAAELAR